MKKIVIILLMTCVLAGCGKLSDAEAKTAMKEALTNAFTAAYIANGAGLAVFPDTTEELNDKTWYKVATAEYSSINELKELVNKSYSKDIAKELNNTIESKYADINGGLYTLGSGGCALDFDLESIKTDLESKYEIKQIKSSSMTFVYEEKEYKVVKKSGNWVLEEELFDCAS